MAVCTIGGKSLVMFGFEETNTKCYSVSVFLFVVRCFSFTVLIVKEFRAHIGEADQHWALK